MDGILCVVAITTCVTMIWVLPIHTRNETVKRNTIRMVDSEA